jgi:hypothetical protein
LAEILLPHQLDRIKQIQLQTQGASALRNSDVAAKLALNDSQKEDIERIARENQQTIQEEMRELRQGGGEAFQAKMAELRKTADEKLLAVLNAEQKAKFEEMKGAAFELPADAFGFGRRGGRGRGGPGRGD